MLVIKDLIPIEENELDRYKLHLAIGPKHRDKMEPYKALMDNDFKEWQEWQGKRNFQRDFIFSLIYYDRNEWIFGGIYEQNGFELREDCYKYNTELLDRKKELIGRLIIHFERPGRQSYLDLEKWADQLEILEILREKQSIELFPGFQNLCLPFDSLQSIIESQDPTWNTSLSSVKGVYIITDQKNGKNYVGSAYGTDSFWNRWEKYIKTGHGGNKQLKKIITNKGLGYASNFQFAILEICSPVITDGEIIKRETHWKDVLKSRDFGYNKN